MVIRFKEAGLGLAAGKREGKVYTAYEDTTGKAVTFREFMDKFTAEKGASLLAGRFRETLKQSGYEEFFLEFPPINKTQYADKAFSFSVISAMYKEDRLKGRAVDTKAFANKKKLQTVFDNQSGNAKLIIPKKEETSDKKRQHKYHSIGQFSREAKTKTFQDFFDTAFKQVKKRLSQPGMENKPFIISTDGRSEAVLHLRIDEFPKYIKNQHYKAEFAKMLGQKNAKVQQHGQSADSTNESAKKNVISASQAVGVASNRLSADNNVQERVVESNQPLLKPLPLEFLKEKRRQENAEQEPEAVSQQPSRKMTPLEFLKEKRRQENAEQEQPEVVSQSSTRMTPLEFLKERRRQDQQREQQATVDHVTPEKTPSVVVEPATPQISR